MSFCAKQNQFNSFCLERNRLKRFLGIEFTRNRQNLRFCLMATDLCIIVRLFLATNFVAQEPRERKVCVCGVRRPLRFRDKRNAKLARLSSFCFGFTLCTRGFESGFRDLTLCCKVLRGSGACVLAPQLVPVRTDTTVCTESVPGSREVVLVAFDCCS